MLSDIGYSPPSPVGLRGGGCQHWLAPPRSGDRPYVFRPTALPAMPSAAAALLGRATVDDRAAEGRLSLARRALFDDGQDG
jgi:hypothetical protein